VGWRLLHSAHRRRDGGRDGDALDAVPEDQPFFHSGTAMIEILSALLAGIAIGISITILILQ
jgi:hypothetical protein